MGELWFRVRDFFRYSKLEKKDLLISILVITLVFAYNDGQDSFNLAYWFAHFLLILVIVTVTFLVHTGTQKFFALQQGFVAEYKAWPLGLAISVVFTLLTGGKWFLILPGGISIIHVPILRIGRWRYGLNNMSKALIGASGAIGNLVLATICLAIGAQLGLLPGFFTLAATINFWFLIYTLLPIPNMDGIHLFYVSRLAYVFIFTTLLAYVILASFEIYSWIFSFVIGVICWLLFYLFYER